ncbi:GTP 3',8-cyclase MoaA [bacterium]
MIDAFNRTIEYLRISVTDLCNLRCKYCMPLNGTPKLLHDDILRLEEIEEIAKIFIELGIKKIRLTGGEPLVRKNILHLIKRINHVKELAITTNGILLKQHAKELKDSGMHRINISLDTLDEKKYFDLTRNGDLNKVLDGIREAKKYYFNAIKLNVVLMKDVNENEIHKFRQFAKDENIKVRFIELMPFGELCSWANDKYISSNIVPTSKNVSVISSVSNNFCDTCNRVRLTADGKLKLCLHGNELIDLKTPLRQGKDIKKLIVSSVLKKPKSHKLEKEKYTNMNMFQIGG